MQWESRVGLFFCLALFAWSSPGCKPTAPPVTLPPTPHRGAALSIACPNAAMAERMHHFGQSWALRQGVQLNLRVYDPTDETSLHKSSSDPDDIWVLSPAELPHWAAAGQLAEFPESYRTPDNPYAWSDLLPTFREQLLLWEGKPYGVPLVGESLLCCYRLDLLSAPEHQSALRERFGSRFEGPLTWAQFAQLAEYFHQHPIGGKRTASLPPLPRADEDLDRLFYTVAAGYARRAVPAAEARGAAAQDDVFSFHYDLKTGRPRIATPGFVEALKWLQRVQACRPAEPADQPEEEFRAGRAVLCLTDAPWLKRFQKEPALRDKIGVCRVPGGEFYFDFEKGKSHATPTGNRVPYLGGSGWLAVVPRDSSRSVAAFDLLTDLTGPKSSTQLFLAGKDHSGPTRTDQLYRARWDTFDLEEKQELRLREAMQETLLHRSMKNPAFCLRTPRQASHRAILVKAIREAILKGIDAEQTLQTVADAWMKLDREQGMEAHLADYRRSLGLLAGAVRSKQ